jgi:hypothetical protein
MKLISYSKQIGGIVEFCYWAFFPLTIMWNNFRIIRNYELIITF